MAITLDDLVPGSLIVWEDAAPPFEPFVPGTGPNLAVGVVLREVDAAELVHFSLSGEFVWAVVSATPGAPVAVPAEMVLAVHPAVKVTDGLAAYYPLQA